MFDWAAFFHDSALLVHGIELGRIVGRGMPVVKQVLDGSERRLDAQIDRQVAELELSGGIEAQWDN